jgi:fatty-acyl-CoA synthase
LPPSGRAALKARQGVRYPALEDLTVMDPRTMTPVAADGETLGEVMFRGNIVMKGYLGNPEATEEAFAGGWFHSGDLGVLHPDGYIQLKDRSKDIIISGERTSPPSRSRTCSTSTPAVAACAVVGKARREVGRDPRRLHRAETRAGGHAEDIIALCRDHLARYKCPRHVVFAEVPKTSTGKIQKFVLRERAKGV